MKRDDLIREIERVGCVFIRHGGKHGDFHDHGDAGEWLYGQRDCFVQQRQRRHTGADLCVHWESDRHYGRGGGYGHADGIDHEQYARRQLHH